MKKNLESCPSWPKEHDWKSCNRSKPVRGFESLALRQNEKQVARPAFCIGKTKRGIRTRREQTCLRKKTVRWTVFADVVKERSDAKVHGSAPKKSLALRHKKNCKPYFSRFAVFFFSKIFLLYRKVEPSFILHLSLFCHCNVFESIVKSVNNGLLHIC